MECLSPQCDCTPFGILGYASFETYLFKECPWNMWKIHEFPETVMSRIDMSRRVPNLGHENTRLQYLGRQKHARWAPCRTCPCFFLGAQTIPMVGDLWDIHRHHGAPFQEHLWRKTGSASAAPPRCRYCTPSHITKSYYINIVSNFPLATDPSSN